MSEYKVRFTYTIGGATVTAIYSTASLQVLLDAVDRHEITIHAITPLNNPL